MASQQSDLLGGMLGNLLINTISILFKPGIT